MDLKHIITMMTLGAVKQVIEIINQYTCYKRCINDIIVEDNTIFIDVYYDIADQNRPLTFSLNAVGRTLSTAIHTLYYYHDKLRGYGNTEYKYEALTNEIERAKKILVNNLSSNMYLRKK